MLALQQTMDEKKYYRKAVQAYSPTLQRGENIKHHAPCRGARVMLMLGSIVPTGRNIFFDFSPS